MRGIGTKAFKARSYRAEILNDTMLVGECTSIFYYENEKSVTELLFWGVDGVLYSRVLIVFKDTERFLGKSILRTLSLYI